MDLQEILATLLPNEDANLLVGPNTMDDAGVYRLSDDLAIVLSVDFITPVSDDPYQFGQVAAANSLSDIYAMGGKPITALNLCCFPPKGIERQDLAKILQGAAEKLKEAETTLVGGHTVKDNELKYGLAVTGLIHPDRVFTNSTAQAGDRVILTKPIGTGVIITAAKHGRIAPAVLEQAIDQMTRLNKAASEIMTRYDTHACTDVTGFGLSGHLREISLASQASIKIDFSQIPYYPESLELTAMGVRTGMTAGNHDLVQDIISLDETISQAEEWLLYDPQTSGGLLISVGSDDAEELLCALREVGLEYASLIGEVDASGGPSIRVVKH